MSSIPKFTLPEIFGDQHGITSPQTPISTVNQGGKSGKCMFIVQEYHCPLHAHLSTPHLLHRSPCWEALLPRKQQKECENYTRREEKLVQVARYEKGRGCMDCKAIARKRRREEAAKNAEIVRKMGDLKLGEESCEERKKAVDCLSSLEIKRVIAHVSARVEEIAGKEVLMDRGSELKHEENEKEAQELNIQAKQEQDTPISTTITEAIQSPNPTPSQASSSTQRQPDIAQDEKENSPPTTQNPDPDPDSALELETAREEHEILSNILQEVDEEVDEELNKELDEELNEELDEELNKELDEEFDEELNEEVDEEFDEELNKELNKKPNKHPHTPLINLDHSTSSITSSIMHPSTEWYPSPAPKNNITHGEVALAPGISTSKEDEWVVLGSWETKSTYTSDGSIS